MTIDTSNLYSQDAKRILYNTINDEFTALKISYPTQLSVFVSMVYPQTVELLDEYKALITIARVSAPQELLFVGDLLDSGVSNVNWQQAGGSLSTDFFEIGIWSFDPDYRDQMYYIIRQMLLDKRNYLMRQGFTQVVRTGGGDQEIDLVAQPRIIYRATHIYKIQAVIQNNALSDLLQTLHVEQVIQNKLDNPTSSGTQIVM